MATFAPPAEAVEVLEKRLLLTPTPFLAFAVQPSNGIAGHGFNKFTVDVMETVEDKNRFRHVVIDTAYTGAYLVTANGPGVLVEPANAQNGANAPLSAWSVFINKGVGTYLAKFNIAALDVAGTYSLTATSPAADGNTSVPGNAVSSKFTISPDTSTDHLVFVNLLDPIIGIPTDVNVAVEDQFGNIDNSISNVSVTLQVFSGTSSTATLNAGEATFKNVTFAGPGPDVLLASAFAGPNGIIIGLADVPVIPLPSAG